MSVQVVMAPGHEGEEPVRGETVIWSSPEPTCDMCGAAGVRERATVDGATWMGPWACMCDGHHKMHGVGIGTGKGQRIIGWTVFG